MNPPLRPPLLRAAVLRLGERRASDVSREQPLDIEGPALSWHTPG